jgi:hypothetical protein
MATSDIAGGDYQKLCQLASLDNYERLTLTKRKRASRKL